MSARATLLVLLLGGLFASTSRADEPTNVAVLPFEAVDVEDAGSVGAAAADLLAAALSEARTVRLLDREHVEHVLHEQALGPGLAPGAASRVGGILGAQVVVTGTVAETEGGWRLVLRAIRVPDGAVLAAVDVTEERGRFARAAAGAAGEVLARMNAEVPPLRETDDQTARASLHYLRGLGFERAGLFGEAIGEWLEARRLAVRFPETEFWMGRAYLRARRPEHAAVALRRFVETVPAHALSVEARRLLAQAERVVRERPAPPRERSLAEVLLSESDPAIREAAVSAAIARGADGVHELAAAYRLPHEAEVATRMLLAVADRDPDRFVAILVDDPELLQLWPGDLARRLDGLLTPDLARRVARGIRSTDAAARGRVVRFLYYVMGQRWGDRLEAMDEVFRETADHPDEAISLTALGLTANDPESQDRIGARLADPAFSASYRCELLMLGAENAHRHDAIADGILALLGDENEELRRVARLAVNFSGRNPRSGESDRLARWRRRTSRRVADLLRSRRFPHDALDFFDMCQMDPADLGVPEQFARELLHSGVPEERAAGLRILRRLRGPRTAEAAWAALDDEDVPMIQIALAILGEQGAPEDTAARLLAWWRRAQRAEGQGALDYRLHIRGSLQFAFASLVRRASRKRHAGHESLRGQPPPEAGPDAYEAWWVKLFERPPAEDPDGEGVEGE